VAERGVGARGRAAAREVEAEDGNPEGDEHRDEMAALPLVPGVAVSVDQAGARGGPGHLVERVNAHLIGEIRERHRNALDSAKVRHVTLEQKPGSAVARAAAGTRGAARLPSRS
jgi:hypothetical protein